MALYLLFESASGYGIFNFKGIDEIGQAVDKVQESINDIARFGKVMTLHSFKPFASAAGALEQINAISEAGLSNELKEFLLFSLPKVKPGKKPKFHLGVSEAKLGSVIQAGINVPCVCNEFVGELLRGIRNHFTRYIQDLQELDLQKAQLGLAHSYSRAKVKFNVNKVDNMIIQAIALLDTLDKDINTFVMRVREWYSWHFPELVRIVSDNYQYTRVALFVKDKSNLIHDNQEVHQGLVELLGDEGQAQQVIEAAKTSMGQDISPIDLINIETFARRVISLAEYRHNLHAYLLSKMHVVAPNLSALIGEVVGARLISHAGSLTNLAKYPASTVQILGAEKALFRALKTKGNTPKYGLIFHSSFIGRAKQRNKGRISRYLANKCSIASRIDCFIDTATSAFGEKLKDQVEERLKFYEEGTAPRKNLTVMAEVMEQLKMQVPGDGTRNVEAAAGDKQKKKKKSKKEKHSKEAPDSVSALITAEKPVNNSSGKVKKKKKKRDVEAAEPAVKRRKK